jgi:hypothetical protein
VALLPPIPDRPADRPETWPEYLSRRAIVAMHRQFADELASLVQNFDAFDPFRYFDQAFDRMINAPVLPARKRIPLLIDEDVTWREDAVRRLLADPVVMQVTDVDIDLAPDKELIPPAEAKWINEEIERLGSALVSLAYARGLQILNGE